MSPLDKLTSRNEICLSTIRYLCSAHRSEVRDCGKLIQSLKERGILQMSCFVILLLFNKMQMSLRRFSAIPHLRGASGVSTSNFSGSRPAVVVTVTERILTNFIKLKWMKMTFDSHRPNEINLNKLEKCLPYY